MADAVGPTGEVGKLDPPEVIEKGPPAPGALHRCHQCGKEEVCTPQSDFMYDPGDPDQWVYCDDCFTMNAVNGAAARAATQPQQAGSNPPYFPPIPSGPGFIPIPPGLASALQNILGGGSAGPDPGSQIPEFRCAHPLEAAKLGPALPKTLAEKLDETNDLLREILRQLGGQVPAPRKPEYEGFVSKKDAVVLPDDDGPDAGALG